MMSSTPPRGASSERRPGGSTHAFAVGQSVRLKGGFGRPRLPEIYLITATLPARGDQPQYRIRCEGERYERVATQDHLEAASIVAAGENASLIERTFGHG